MRLNDEYRQGHLEGAVNLPLRMLRKLAHKLPRGRRLIVYCDTGSRSAAAAYLLSERGFEVRVLREGYPPETAAPEG